LGRLHPPGGTDGRVPRRELDEDQEGEDRDDPQDEDQEEDPPDQVTSHPLVGPTLASWAERGADDRPLPPPRWDDPGLTSLRSSGQSGPGRSTRSTRRCGSSTCDWM